jgi:hypothetical protein
LYFNAYTVVIVTDLRFISALDDALALTDEERGVADGQLAPV